MLCHDHKRVSNQEHFTCSGIQAPGMLKDSSRSEPQTSITFKNATIAWTKLVFLARNISILNRRYNSFGKDNLVKTESVHWDHGLNYHQFSFSLTKPTHKPKIVKKAYCFTRRPLLWDYSKVCKVYIQINWRK